MGNRIFRRAFAIAAALNMCTWSTFSAGAPLVTCVTPPVDLGSLSGAPTWFPSTTSDVTVRPELDDPRWAGGPLLAFEGSGGMGAPLYRMVRDGEYLSVSVHSPLSTPGTDTVYFGFTEGLGETKSAFLLAIDPEPASAGSSDPIVTHVTRYHEYCGGNQCPLPSNAPAGTVNPCPATGWCLRQGQTPPWLSDVATWRAADTGLDFAVSFKIRYAGTTAPGEPPLALAKIPPNQQFRIFIGLGLSLTTGVVQYSAPLIPAGTTQWIDPAIHVPKEHWVAWAKYDGIGKPCLRGVTVDPLDIHTSGVDDDSNSFEVTARNIAGDLVRVPTGMLNATLRSAEWGAVSCDPMAAWEPLPGGTPTWSHQWLSSTTGPVKPGTDAARMSFTCDFTSPTDPNCPSLPPAAEGDSAVSGGPTRMRSLLGAVEPNANGGHLQFSVPSAIRNMAFASLSQFEQTATISIKGLERVTGKKVAKRDVFLQVKRRNMPAHGRAQMELPLKEMKRIQRFVLNPPQTPFDQPPPIGDNLYQAKTAVPAQKTAQKPGVPTGKDLPQPKDPPAPKDEPAQKPKFEEIPLEYSSAARIELLNRVWPAYEVHAFYDTGETIVVKGKPQKVLNALMPFGYLLQHEGPFYGFTDAITFADGKPLERVGEDLYRVSIPAEGSVKIKTLIRAEEHPPCGDCAQCKPPVVNVNLRGCHCRAVGGSGEDRGLLPFALIPLLAFVARRFRSRRAGRPS